MASLTITGTSGTAFGNGGVGFAVADSYPAYGAYPYAANLLTQANISNATQGNALKNLVDGLLNLGLLHPSVPAMSKLKALWPIIGGNAAAHALNLLDARPLPAAHALSYQGGIVHSATGLQTDGIDGFADTNLSLASVLTATSLSFGAYLRPDKAGRGGYRVDLGNIDNNNYNSLNVASGNTSYYGAASGETGASRPGSLPTTKGLWVVQNNGLAAQCYLNNTLLSSTTNLRNTLPAVSFGIGGCYYNNGPPNLFADNEYALVFICEALTPAEIASFTALVNTYQTALGRQV